MDLFEETRTLLRALDASTIPYALCGALALAVHGCPRYTADIDLLIESQSVEPIIDVAKRCGFVFGTAPIAFSDGVEIRLRQVASMWRLGRWLASRGDLSPLTTPCAPRR